ncbi:MAG: Crp/Fnr family transcriptional regulator [Propionivibrio sp.]|uniref:Crp/Fnr family transcriptional regulator n=1 Tax=Candidatus Propionivibrio dominans TaxID=2954373 RepID=A0A9D7FAX7_9RHOO|nr:Crp/Fnr family transcriptional regulator [Candidatus Propionivibrio dominans]MBL0166337.1 Crp/Fnr family transcriptional regulator [Propionivibrio sp.]
MRSLNEMLMASAWARELSAEQFQQINEGIVVRTIPTGGFVCMKGEPVEYWMGVVDGLVKMASIWSTGKITSFTGLSAGGWFGEGSLLKNEPRKYDVIALRESRVAYMNRSTFQWLCDNSIHFNRFLITQLNERLGQFIAMMEHERLLDPDARLARCLASLFNPVLYPESNLELKISQEEIGLLAGISRQRVNQALRKLEEAGLLHIDYGSITILDLAGLRCFGE